MLLICTTVGTPNLVVEPSVLGHCCHSAVPEASVWPLLLTEHPSG